MNDVIKELGDFGIIPVVKIDNVSNSENLAKALINGDLPVAEITFRTDAAEESIKRINKKYPEILLGAGTVLGIEQVKRAVGAGAMFIVAPGFNPELVDYCVSNNIIIIPGVNSGTQIEAAMDYGLDVLKFFPAEASGGVGMIKSLSAPYSNIKFIPTGGINISNILDYLTLDSVHACGGSWLVSSKLILEGRFEEITKLTKQVVSKIMGFGLDSINNKIILECSNIERTISYLKRKGFKGKSGIGNEDITIVQPAERIDIVIKKSV